MRIGRCALARSVPGYPGLNYGRGSRNAASGEDPVNTSSGRGAVLKDLLG